MYVMSYAHHDNFPEEIEFSNRKCVTNLAFQRMYRVQLAIERFDRVSDWQYLQ